MFSVIQRAAANLSRRHEDGFGVREFLVTAVVAAVVDEFLGGSEIGGGRFPRILPCFVRTSDFRVPISKQPCSVEVDVGQEKFHRAALGDFPGFVQIVLRAGKETSGFLRVTTQLVRRLVLRSLGEEGSFSEGAPGAGEEAVGKEVLRAGAAEAASMAAAMCDRSGAQGRKSEPSRIAA